jgi:hypothetical protein
MRSRRHARWPTAAGAQAAPAQPTLRPAITRRASSPGIAGSPHPRRNQLRLERRSRLALAYGAMLGFWQSSALSPLQCIPPAVARDLSPRRALAAGAARRLGLTGPCGWPVASPLWHACCSRARPMRGETGAWLQAWDASPSRRSGPLRRPALSARRSGGSPARVTSRRPRRGGPIGPRRGWRGAPRPPPGLGRSAARAPGRLTVYRPGNETSGNDAAGSLEKFDADLTNT